MKIHDVTILVCDDCVHLRGQMCHVPECVFCRRTMDEVRETLDRLNVCPIIDGERHVLIVDEPEHDEPVCDRCQGDGEVPTADYESYLGAMMKPCPKCHGTLDGLGHGRLS